MPLSLLLSSSNTPFYHICPCLSRGTPTALGDAQPPLRYRFLSLPMFFSYTHIPAGMHPC